jgi:hypothetical protein
MDDTQSSFAPQYPYFDIDMMKVRLYSLLPILISYLSFYSAQSIPLAVLMQKKRDGLLVLPLLVNPMEITQTTTAMLLQITVTVLRQT